MKSQNVKSCSWIPLRFIQATRQHVMALFEAMEVKQRSLDEAQRNPG